MPLHNTLTGAELHEPKGVENATIGQVYVADGAGSGTWVTPPSGFGYYKDDAAARDFNTVPSLLSLDGLAATTLETALPLDIRGSGSLWDTSTNRITPIAEHDAYEIRIDLPITAEAGNPNDLTLKLDINAGSDYSSAISIVTRYFPTGRTTPYVMSAGFPIFVGSTFLSNGGQFWLYTDTGTVTIENPGIFISRVHGEVI